MLKPLTLNPLTPGVLPCGCTESHRCTEADEKYEAFELAASPEQRQKALEAYAEHVAPVSGGYRLALAYIARNRTRRATAQA